MKLIYVITLASTFATGFALAQQSRKTAVLQPSAAKPIEKTENEPGNQIGETGYVTFTYQGKKVKYATVLAADGNIWLQQNLGSIKVATTFNDEDALGDLFQWGRWDDGHQLIIDVPDTRNEAPIPNNPAGLKKQGTNPYYYQPVNTWWLQGDPTDSWTAATPAEATATNGCDPCKAVGKGWRLPTRDELNDVYKIEHITDGYGAVRSNLKLPSGGYRDGRTYVVMGRGREGIYWTSKADKAASTALEWGPKSGSALRGFAFSIRCIKSPINQ